MTTTKTYDEDDSLTEVFVGRRIVAVDGHTNTFTLDNGAKVQVIGNYGCGGCGNGGYYVERFIGTEHVITGVQVSAEDEVGPDNDTQYSITVYSAGVPVGEDIVLVSGNDGNGYYGTGYTLTVTLP